MESHKAATTGAVPAQLLGTWKLVSNTMIEMPSGTRSDLMGTQPMGFINYCADGRMMFIAAEHGRTRPAGAKATPAEAEALFRTFLAYCGTFSVSGNTVTHHVDISWNESWTGSDQVRTFRFEGNRVTLSTPLSPDPVQGRMSIRELVWEKVA